MDNTGLKNMPSSEEYSSSEEKKKKRLVATKLDGTGERDAKVVHFFEINENEHIGMRWLWLNLKKKDKIIFKNTFRRPFWFCVLFPQIGIQREQINI